MNLYEILGIGKDAKPDEVRRAYRRLALRYHPDTGGEADSSRFRQIQEAYEVLSSPAAKARYDGGLQGGISVRRMPARYPDTPVEPLIPPDRYTPGPRPAFYSAPLHFRQDDPFENLLRFVDYIFRRF